jgi:hypothetical protein
LKIDSLSDTSSLPQNAEKSVDNARMFSDMIKEYPNSQNVLQSSPSWKNERTIIAKDLINTIFE